MNELTVAQLPGKGDGPSTTNERGGAGGLRPVGLAPHRDRHGGVGLLRLHTERFGAPPVAAAKTMRTWASSCEMNAHGMLVAPAGGGPLTLCTGAERDGSYCEGFGTVRSSSGFGAVA